MIGPHSVFFAVTILAAAGGSCEVDAWVPDRGFNGVDLFRTQTVHQPLGFIATNCQLTSQGITVYGTLDVRGGWQSHGAPPFDPRSTPRASYPDSDREN
jgi:hypothetical protein